MDPFGTIGLDLWQRIFRAMSCSDRIQCESVSKRFLFLTEQAWMGEPFFDTTDAMSFRCAKQAAAVIAICTRIGADLRSLRLASELPLRWADALRTIAQTCPNIHSIEIIVGRPRCDWDYCVPSDVRFNDFTQLRSLRFLPGRSSEALASATVLRSVPHSIETLVGLSSMQIDSHRFETGAQLEAFFEDRPFLREVRLRGISVQGGERAHVFPVIARCPQLKRLSLYACDVSISGVELLSDMIELELYFGVGDTAEHLTDEQMTDVCTRNPCVEILRLGWHSRTLSAYGFRALRGLKRLRELDVRVGRLNVVQMDVVVRELVAGAVGASLECLFLRGRWQLSEAAILAIAAKCAVTLRETSFSVAPGGVAPEVVRYLVEQLAHPSKAAVEVVVWVCDVDSEVDAFTPFQQLTTAPLPAGVRLNVYRS